MRIVISTAHAGSLASGFARAKCGLAAAINPIQQMVADHLGLALGERLERTDARLIEAVLAVDPQAQELAVVEVPDGVSWAVIEYDGAELVVEVGWMWNRHGCQMLAPGGTYSVSALIQGKGVTP